MARQDLCPNPALKNNNTGWGGGSTPARVTTLSGASSARTTGALYTTGTFMQGPNSPALTGVDGLPFTISIDIQPNGSNIGGGTFYVAFKRSTGGDDFSHTFTLGSITAGTWAHKTFTATAPTNTTGVYLIIDSINFGAITGGVNFTGLIYEQAASDLGYFDGDSPSASWDGTNGNSTSTLTTGLPAVTPNSIAIALGLGQPSTAIPGVAPDGIAIALSLGQPSTAIPGVAPSGLPVALSLGTPAVSLAAVTPNGLALPVGLGTPSTGIPGVTPNGLSIPVTPGSPAVGSSITPAGLALPVSLGQPAIGILGVSPAGIAIGVTPGQPSASMISVAPAGLAIAVSLGRPATEGMAPDQEGVTMLAPITVPYVTVPSFRASPTFTDSLMLNVGSTSSADQDAELYNTLLKASAWASNTVCNMSLHAHTVTENLRLRPNRRGLLSFLAEDGPVRMVTGFSYGYQPGPANLRPVSDLSQQWIEGDRQILMPFGLASAGWASLQFSPPAAGSELFTQWTYVAGYVNTTVAVAVLAGSTSIQVKDPTGIMPGDTLRIWEPGKEEAVTVAASYTIGSATVPLTAALTNTHALGVGISGFPPDILQAVTNYTVALLMRPDSMAEDEFPDGAPATTTRSNDPRQNGGGLVAEARRLLRSYTRVR